MQPQSDSGKPLEPDVHGALPSRPWWRGAVSQNVEGTLGNGIDPSQRENGLNSSDDVDKRNSDLPSEAGSDESHGQEQQHQPVTSSMPLLAAEYLIPHTQLEYGHSIACAPYVYSDACSNGLLNAYGAQTLVQTQLLGMPHTRMALPLEMAEEPVYVNAKQYHGILRRRQTRAKLELERKLIKSRKPYLHESRHQHAMRRARGSGGRFLNKKEVDGKNVASPIDSTTLQSSSESSIQSSEYLVNADFDAKHRELAGHSDAHNSHKLGDFGYRHQQESSFPSSSFHPAPNEREGEDDCSGQPWDGILVNQPPNRIVAIQ